MPDETIPDDVRQFLREYIHSYEHLEVLVRLAGAPGEPWSAERVAADVPTSVQTADEALRHLAGRGVLQVTVQAGTPRYELTRDAAMAQTVDALARVYAARRLDVMNLMSAHAVERVRSSAIRAFARAFLFGRKPDA